jgi:hypothetical protein
MTEQPDPAQGRPLTPTQASRVDFARQGLEEARGAELATLEGHRLILLIERLRGSLDDMLHLVDEIAGPTPRP